MRHLYTITSLLPILIIPIITTTCTTHAVTTHTSPASEHDYPLLTINAPIHAVTLFPSHSRRHPQPTKHSRSHGAHSHGAHRTHNTPINGVGAVVHRQLSLCDHLSTNLTTAHTANTRITVTIPSLSSNIIPDSLRVTAHGPISLRSVTTTHSDFLLNLTHHIHNRHTNSNSNSGPVSVSIPTHPQPHPQPQPEPQPHQHQLTSLAAATRDVKIADASIAFLSAIITAKQQGPHTTFSSLAPLLRHLHQQRHLRRAAQLVVAELRGEAKVEKALRDAEHHRQATDVKVDMDVDVDGESGVCGSGGGKQAVVKVEYMVKEAAWLPTCDVREDATGSVSLSYRASIEQWTDEDWKDVEVRLSTSEMQRVVGGEARTGRLYARARARGQGRDAGFVTVSGGAATAPGTVSVVSGAGASSRTGAILLSTGTASLVTPHLPVIQQRQPSLHHPSASPASPRHSSILGSRSLLVPYPLTVLSSGPHSTHATLNSIAAALSPTSLHHSSASASASSSKRNNNNNNNNNRDHRRLLPLPPPIHASAGDIHIRSPTLVHFIYPRQHPSSAYLTLLGVNAATVPLLSSHCNVYVGDRLASTAHLPRVSAGERFALTLIKDANVKVHTDTKATVPDLASGPSSWVFSSDLTRTLRRRYTHTTKVTNVKDSAVTVSVELAVPMSRHVDHSVELRRPALSSVVLSVALTNLETLAASTNTNANTNTGSCDSHPHDTTTSSDSDNDSDSDSDTCSPLPDDQGVGGTPSQRLFWRPPSTYSNLTHTIPHGGCLSHIGVCDVVGGSLRHTNTDNTNTDAHSHPPARVLVRAVEVDATSGKPTVVQWVLWGVQPGQTVSVEMEYEVECGGVGEKEEGDCVV